MGEMGYFGTTIPESMRGLGLGSFDYCIIPEELAGGWMSVASLISMLFKCSTVIDIVVTM